MNQNFSPELLQTNASMKLDVKDVDDIEDTQVKENEPQAEDFLSKLGNLMHSSTTSHHQKTEPEFVEITKGNKGSQGLFSDSKRSSDNLLEPTVSSSFLMVDNVEDGEAVEDDDLEVITLPGNTTRKKSPLIQVQT